MNSETRTCQNCQKTFVIEPEDFKFYEKISVPPPTWCPECRVVRRMMWRNEITSYNRKCDVLGHDEKLFSLYSPNKKYIVYEQKYWWSDSWSPVNFGRDYVFSKPFFEQFKTLFGQV